MDSTRRAVYALAIEAARVGDVASLVRLAPSIPMYVSINPERHAVQVASCLGSTLVASLQIPDTLPILRNESSAGAREHGRRVASTIGFGLELASAR